MGIQELLCTLYQTVSRFVRMSIDISMSIVCQNINQKFAFSQNIKIFGHCVFTHAFWQQANKIYFLWNFLILLIIDAYIFYVHKNNSRGMWRIMFSENRCPYHTSQSQFSRTSENVSFLSWLMKHILARPTITSDPSDVPYRSNLGSSLSLSCGWKLRKIGFWERAPVHKVSMLTVASKIG